MRNNLFIQFFINPLAVLLRLSIVCLTDEEFQSQVLGGIKAQKTASDSQSKRLDGIENQQKTLLENYDQLDKQTKQAMEDLTTAKNALNNVSDFEKALKRFETQLRREQRMAYGDPVQRICADEEKRARINCTMRTLCHSKVGSEMQKALGLDSSPGATLIDDELATELYDVLASYGKWATLGVRSVGKSTTKYPIKTARPVAKFFRRSAGGKLAEDANKAGTQVSTIIEPFGVLLTVDEELLEDAEIDLSQDILQDFAQATNLLLDHMAFTAAGADNDSDAEFAGIFAAGTAVTAAATHTTQGTLTLADWLKPLLAVAPVVLERQPKWWMHPQNLVRSLGVKDENGRPIFLTAIEAPAAGGIGSILGFPVELVHAAPNTDTAGSKVAAFGDPQSQIVAIRKQVEFAESADWKFSDVQRAFRAVGRAATGTRRSDAFGILTLAAS